MTNRQPVEIDVDELMAKVRAEVRRRNSLDEAMPPVQAPSVASAQAPSSQPESAAYRVADFLRYHDVDFVERAYLAILGRPPDTSGYSHYVNELRQGRMTKVEILGCLRYSPEGKARNVVLKGLWAPYLAHRSFKVPVLGYFGRWLLGLLRLPTIIGNFQRLDVAIPFQLASLKEQLSDQLEAKMSTAFQSQIDEIKRGKLVQLTNELERVGRDLDALSALMAQKADKRNVELLASRKADQEAIQILASRMVSREDMSALLARRVAREELESLFAQQAEQDGIVALKQWIADTGKQIQDLKVSLLDQQRRLMLLLEEAGKRDTPYPDKPLVGSCAFYTDPTHRKPWPPDSLDLLAKQRGFVRTQILWLHLIHQPEYTGQELVDELLRRAHTARDYAIIAHML